ncbi:MAG: hypothetical protein HOQ09_00670 [Gemmatimonadaceae bacterium]|nr:hypothetical protein [Gemmatimonadaceae bacterium]
MRATARALVLTVILLAAGCREGAEQSSAEAARADSSAAGYEVGPAPSATASIADSTGRIAAAGPPRAAHADSARAIARRDSARSDSARRDSVTRALAVREKARHDSVARDSSRRVAERDSLARSNRRTQVTTTVPPTAGPVRVNEFLTYDAKTRTASLQLVAGYNGLNGSLNFNGAMRGSRTFVIPLGWHVHVTVSNHDSDLQHSAIVVREVLPPPLELTTPEFPGAALPRLDEGLQEGETGTLDFVADRPGRYMVACGVPGHAQSGLWLRVVIARGLAVPAYR